MKNPEIPTALSAGESALLGRLAADRLVVEGGALFGYSTVLMAQAGAIVQSIDPHEGYPTPQWPSTRRRYLGNLIRYGVTSRVLPVAGRFEECAAGYFDLAFLDLTGEYEVSLRCLRVALISARIVAVHDFQRQNCNGVELAVEACIGLNLCRPMERADSMLVVERK